MTKIAAISYYVLVIFTKMGETMIAHFNILPDHGGSRNEKYKINKFVERINQTIDVFTSDVFEKFKEYGHKSEKPIFVVGMPRSGTTMDEIIAAHSYAEGVGELSRMSRMANNIAGRNMRVLLEKMAEAGPENWMEIPKQYLNLVDTLAPDARRTVDKMPHNFLHLGFIHLCFPNAKVIHCMRNPLDNFISSFQNPMNAFHRYSFDQEIYGEYFANYLRLMDHWKTVMYHSL